MEATVSPKPSPVPASEGEGRRASAHERSALMANAIRALSMDAVQQANSGHPGAPMGMAEIAVALWNRHLRHNPPTALAGRDRLPRTGTARCCSIRCCTSRLRPRALSEAAQLSAAAQTAGPSRARPHARRRDDDRAARQGPDNAIGMALAENSSPPSSTGPVTASSTITPTSSSATAA
jgi:transketolase